VYRMGILLLLLLVGCGGSTSPNDTAQEPVEEASPSESAAMSPLVGEWRRVTTCQELVQALRDAGLGDLAPQVVAGNGLVRGTPEQLAEKADMCEGAVPREHSHFFTDFGRSDRSTGGGNRSTTARMRSSTSAPSGSVLPLSISGSRATRSCSNPCWRDATKASSVAGWWPSRSRGRHGSASPKSAFVQTWGGPHG
jgi:hypothetical protein